MSDDDKFIEEFRRDLRKALAEAWKRGAEYALARTGDHRAAAKTVEEWPNPYETKEER